MGKRLCSNSDTGAAVTTIPSSAFSIEKHGTLQRPRKVLYGPGNHRLDVKGCFRGKLTIKKKKTEQVIYVVGELSKPLLGLPAIEALILIWHLNTVQAQQEDVKAQYPTVFSGLGKLKEPYKIELEPDAVPYALSLPCRVPLPLRDKVQAELNCMEDMGVISKVTQPTPWCAGIVMVPKPRGKIPIWLCVDLNKWVRRERHILHSSRPHTWYACRGEGLHEAGCNLRLLANPIFRGELTPDNIHHPVPAICIQSPTIRDFVSPRAFPASYVTDVGGVCRGSMSCR